MTREEPHSSPYLSAPSPLAAPVPSDARPRTVAAAHGRRQLGWHESRSPAASLWTLLLVASVLLSAPPIFGPSPISPRASALIPGGNLSAADGPSLGGLAGYFVENRGQLRNGEVRYYVV